ARAVPQLPAPRTQSRTGAMTCGPRRSVAGAGRQDQAGVFVLGLFRLLRQALFVQGLEVHLAQVQRRQRGARDRVGDVGAQVGIEHGRADDAQQRIELFRRDVAASKMPAWQSSTRYRTLSPMRVVTVAVTVDSNTVSARRWPP